MSDLNVYTTSQINALTPITGDMVVDSDLNAVKLYDGAAWRTWNSDSTVVPFYNRWGASFDGSNDFMTVPDDASLNVSSGFTVSAWIYLNSLGVFQGIVSKRDGSGTNYQFYIRNGNVLSYYNGSNLYNDTTTLSSGVWTHVAVSATSNSSASFYINGSISSTHSIGAITSSTSDVYIGQVTGVSHFNGSMDDLAIFDTALDQTAITALYGAAPNAGIPSEVTGAIGYWRMGDDSSDSPVDAGLISGITDSSGNGNDATQSTASKQPTFKALDQSTTSLDFDGSTDYLSAPTITALNAPTAFSSSAWFAYSGSTTASAENIITAGSASDNRFYLQVFNPQNIRYGHSTAFLDISVSTLNSGTWYHLATVHNGTSLEVFLNGVSQGTFSVNAPQSGYGTNFKIGGYAVGGITPIGHFEGALDDVAIFSTALSASDVTSLAASRGAHIVNDLSLSPVAYWRMGEDDSLTDGQTGISQISDASGNGNHATQATAANQPTASIDPVIYV